MDKHTSLLIYGLSGVGKSSFLEMLIRSLLLQLPEGSKARVATAEHYDAYDDGVKDGLIETWRFNNRPHPFETSRFVVKGFWPQDVLDPASKLVQPSLATFQKYPIRVFEGLGTIANYITSNHIEGGLLKRAGDGDVIGPVQEHVQFTDGEQGIGGLCWTHYRIGQMEMLGLVQSSAKMPGITIWTSHEDDGKDRGQQYVGPEVIGSKMTGVIGKEFANLWHLVGVPQDVETTDGPRRLVDRRLYVKEHIYPGGTVSCKGKNSVGFRKQASVPDYFSCSKSGNPDLEVVDRLLKIIPLVS